MVQCDLSVRGNASAVASHVIDQWGGVDVLINNAGGAVGAASGQWPIRMLRALILR